MIFILLHLLILAEKKQQLGHLSLFLSLVIPVLTIPVDKLFFQAVPTSKGQALADEYGIKFFETVKFMLDRSWELELIK